MGGPLKLYDVVMHGVPTRMKLNEADAERYNATPVGSEEAETSAEPEASGAAPKPAAKRRAASNKARTAADKDGGTGGGD